jgi:O-antigen/teichoic acid export membrane protein
LSTPVPAEVKAEVADPGRPLAGSFATTAAIQAVQAVTAVVLARVLGPEGRGELAAVILWPTLIMTLGNLGLGPSTTYFAARTSRLGRLVGSSLAIVALDSLLLVALGAVVVPLVLSGHDAGVTETGLLYVVAFIPFSLLALAMMSILNGLHRFRWFQGLRMLMIGTILAGILLLELSGELTIRTAAIAYAAAYLVTAAIATAVVLRDARGEVSVDRETAARVLSFGLKSQLSTSLWALNERLDQLVISVVLSSASLGLYVVAVTLTSLTTLVGFSFALVALPMLAKPGEREEREPTARAIVGATIVAGAAVSIPILIAEPLIVDLLFGSAFEDSVGVGRVLLLAAMVFGLNRVLEAILQAEGRPLDSSIGEAIALAVTVAGLAVLLPTLGIMGAGVTSLIAYLTSAIFLTRRAARALGVSVAYLLVPDRASLRRALRMTTARRTASGRR